EDGIRYWSVTGVQTCALPIYIRRANYRSLYPRRAYMADTGSSSRLIVRAATAAVLSLALLLPANAQFWGNSWGGRQQQQYNPHRSEERRVGKEERLQ